MMVETRARHSYWRISPDGTRIIWGGRAAIRAVDLNYAAKRLHKTMAEIWPQLQQVKITHAWSGNTGYTFDAMPQVGAVDGIHYALGLLWWWRGAGALSGDESRLSSAGRSARSNRIFDDQTDSATLLQGGQPLVFGADGSLV